MTGNRTTLTTLAITAVIIIAALATGPAAVSAQSDNSVVDTLFSPDSEGNATTADRVVEAAKGTAFKFLHKYRSDDDKNATAMASAVQSTYNNNSVQIENWTNSRVSADPAYDTIQIKFTDEDGGSAYLFLVADVNGTDYENSRAIGMTEFRTLDREVDKQYRLSPTGSSMANGELETFITDYVETGKSPSQQYLDNMKGKFAGEIHGDDLPGMD